MASTISAGTTSGTAIAITGDTTGNLAFTTQAGANTITVPNSTGTLLTGSTSQLVKAWVNYNGVTQTIRGSYNVSSVTYSATGQYIVNLTTALSSVNGCPVGSCSQNGNTSDNGRGVVLGIASTTTINVGSFETNTNNQINQNYIAVAVFGA